MTEQPTREPFRPRVWWSPTQGVIEQVEPRWPGEEMRVVRTRDRRVVSVPDDAVELAALPGLIKADQVELTPEEFDELKARFEAVRKVPAKFNLLANEVLLRELLASIWLYVDWRYVTRQLTTVQQEVWADAVDSGGDPADRGPKAERWWRPDWATCEEPFGDVTGGELADPVTKRCESHSPQDGEQQHG